MTDFQRLNERSRQRLAGALAQRLALFLVITVLSSPLKAQEEKPAPGADPSTREPSSSGSAPEAVRGGSATEPVVVGGVVEPPGVVEELVGSDRWVEVWVKANEAYDEGDYVGATGGYQSLQAAGVDNAALSYNLGNAHLRSGQLGRAIASYRRAQALSPRDENTAANLAFARKSSRDAIEPPGPSAAQRTLLFWHYGLSDAELWAGFAVASILFWGLLGWALFRPRSEVLRWSSGLAFLLFAALGGSLLGKALLSEPVGVIVPQEVDVRVDRSEDAVVRFKLHAGTEVRVRELEAGWVRLQLPDQQQGWLAVEHVELTR